MRIFFPHLQSDRPSFAGPSTRWCWRMRRWSSVARWPETPSPTFAGGRMTWTSLAGGKTTRELQNQASVGIRVTILLLPLLVASAESSLRLIWKKIPNSNRTECWKIWSMLGTTMARLPVPYLAYLGHFHTLTVTRTCQLKFGGGSPCTEMAKTEMIASHGDCITLKAKAWAACLHLIRDFFFFLWVHCLPGLFFFLNASCQNKHAWKKKKIVHQLMKGTWLWKQVQRGRWEGFFFSYRKKKKTKPHKTIIPVNCNGVKTQLNSSVFIERDPLRSRVGSQRGWNHFFPVLLLLPSFYLVDCVQNNC